MRTSFIVSFSISSMILVSCNKDFLDVKNTQELFRESYITNLSTLKEYLNGTFVYFSGYFEDGMATAYPELAADNLRPLTAISSSSMIPQYNWVQPVDENQYQSASYTGNMNPVWFTGYSSLRICNFVVEEVDQYRKENPAKADELKGQALALRAYTFFKMVNVFAQPYTYTQDASHLGIPYITTSDITNPYTRQTVREVYDGIIADLTNAIELLPATVTDTRLMNRTAAKAILARVYLFKEDFGKAKTLAKEITDLVPLMSRGNGYPNDLFKHKQPAQTEVLYQLAPYSGVYWTPFLGYYLRESSSSQTFVASTDIVNILKENPNDIRNIWVLFDAHSRWAIEKFPSGAAPEEPTVAPYPELAYYHAIIRSSEMFLTLAEAAARTADEPTARTCLDAIRKRADPSIASVTATGAPLLDSIYKERRKELAFEGIRLYDLQRWKKGVHRTDVLPGSPTTLSYPSDKFISPIPLSDVRIAGLKQNQGY